MKFFLDRRRCFGGPQLASNFDYSGQQHPADSRQCPRPLAKAVESVPRLQPGRRLVDGNFRLDSSRRHSLHVAEQKCHSRTARRELPNVQEPAVPRPVGKFVGDFERRDVCWAGELADGPKVESEQNHKHRQRSAQTDATPTVGSESQQHRRHPEKRLRRHRECCLFEPQQQPSPRPDAIEHHQQFDEVASV